MPETTGRVGDFDLRVEYVPPPSNERVQTLTAWLVAKWEAERRESDGGHDSVAA